MEKSPEYTGNFTTSTNGVANSSTTPQPRSAFADATDDCAAEKQKKRTVGNIIYDVGVFGSIAWLGVSALSAVSAHEAMHGSNPAFGWWRNINDKVTDGLSNGLSKTILKNASPTTVQGYAKGTAMFLTLGMGGNLLMAPLKWLEDNRQKNAAAIDNLLGTTPPDADTIAHEPKQTWKSVLSGRLTSWGLSYAAFVAMGPKLTGTINDWFGERASALVMKAKPAANPTSVRRWADIAAFDALFTVITASITYIYSRHIAKKGDEQASLNTEDSDTSRSIPHALEEATKTVCETDHAHKTSRFSEKVSHRLPPEKPKAFADRIITETQTAQAR